MAGWVMKTEFVTETPLEHGNWSSVEFETFEEAWQWWHAPDTKSAHDRVMTMIEPEGMVVDKRYVPAGGRE